MLYLDTNICSSQHQSRHVVLAVKRSSSGFITDSSTTSTSATWCLVNVGRQGAPRTRLRMGLSAHEPGHCVRPVTWLSGARRARRHRGTSTPRARRTSARRTAERRRLRAPPGPRPPPRCIHRPALDHQLITYVCLHDAPPLPLSPRCDAHASGARAFSPDLASAIDSAKPAAATGVTTGCRPAVERALRNSRSSRYPHVIVAPRTPRVRAATGLGTLARRTVATACVTIMVIGADRAVPLNTESRTTSSGLPRCPSSAKSKGLRSRTAMT